MTQRITATEAARNLSEFLNRVRYRGETLDIVRGGQVVARLTTAPTARTKTVGELFELLSRLRTQDSRFADDLELIQREQPDLPGDPWGT